MKTLSVNNFLDQNNNNKQQQNLQNVNYVHSDEEREENFLKLVVVRALIFR